MKAEQFHRSQVDVLSGSEVKAQARCQQVHVCTFKVLYYQYVSMCIGGSASVYNPGDFMWVASNQALQFPFWCIHLG